MTVVDRRFLAGLLLWALCLQYYVVQIVVALSWKLPYSLAHNTISDLGNTLCGAYGSRLVCSPLHSVMNASFVVLGILMAGGAAAIYQGVQKSTSSSLGFSCMAIAGLGTVLVGLFPENTVSILHSTGAALPFLIGNVGLLFFGFVPDIPKPFRLYALFSGSVALLALGLFMTHHYLGIGIGGTERFVAYPQTVWLIIFAIYMLSTLLPKKYKA